VARDLRVDIIGDSSSYEKALRNATHASGGLSRSLKTLGKVAAVGVGAAFAGLAVVLKQGFDELSEGQKVSAQTGAALKSTGASAWVTKGQIEGLASSLSAMSGTDDEVIQSGENLLLTFKSIQNQVGANNDIFNQATAAALDMSVAFHQELGRSSIQLGKALEDPVKGVTALRRVGISFSESQIKMIKSLESTGQHLEAQKLILREVNKQVEGSAKAYGETLPGQLAKLRNSFDEASGKLAAVFLPALTAGIRAVNDHLIPAMQHAVDWVGKFFDSFQKAKSPQAKLSVIADAFKGLAMSITTSISHALLGYDKLVSGPQQAREGALVVHVQGLADKFAQAMTKLDWGKVGDALIAGMVSGIKDSAKAAKQIADLFTQSMRQVNWEAVGTAAGPGLATAIAAAFVAITDPSFWIRNWELALAVAINALILLFPEALGAKLVAPLTRVGGDMVLYIAGGLEKASPRLAAAFLRMMEALPRLLAGPFRSLESATRSFFGKLGGLAVFTVRVLGVAALITVIERLVGDVGRAFVRLTDKAAEVGRAVPKAIGEGIASGWHWIVEQLEKLPGVITHATTAAVAAAASGAAQIGAAITRGILSGMTGLFSAVKDKIIGGVQGAISGAMGIFGHSPQEVIGIALIDGIIRGWNAASSKLKPAMVDKVNSAIDAAQAAVVAKQGAFAAAFDALLQNALSAFDKASEEFLTRTEKKIAAQDERRAKADRQRALDEAKAQLEAAQAAAAKVSGTPNEFGIIAVDPAAVAQAQADLKAAQQSVADAQFAIQRAADEKTAEAERKAYEDKRERQRVHLANQLAALEQNYLNQQISTEQFHTQLIAIFKKFEVPLGKAAYRLGASLADGLNKSFAAVQSAARALASEVLKAFENIKVVVHVSLEGTAPEHRQHGGMVKANRPYIVGEAGPELFVPNAGGTINTASSRATMAAAGGGGPVVNIYGDVTGDEVVRKVREGLLRIDFYNPGSAIARS
jgi:hypothetical protein